LFAGYNYRLGTGDGTVSFLAPDPALELLPALGGLALLPRPRQPRASRRSGLSGQVSMNRHHPRTRELA